MFTLSSKSYPFQQIYGQNMVSRLLTRIVALLLAADATKFKDSFEKCAKGDFTGMTVIKQDAEDAAKAAEDSKKEEKKAD
jgi:23S rRNA G2445 N2-methylase RlmL